MFIEEPYEVNGMKIDKNILNVWPEEFSGCWILICIGIVRSRIFLIKNNNNPEGSVIESLNYPEEYIAFIEWDSKNFITQLHVSPEYRDMDIGYILGVWSRAWSAVNRDAWLVPVKLNQHLEAIESIILKYKDRYNLQ